MIEFDEKQKKIMDRLLRNKMERDFSKCIGTGCHKIIKLTDKKVILKPCFDKGNITYYFNFEEQADVLLYYLLVKEGGEGTHWSLKREIRLFPSYLVDEKLTEDEMTKLIKEYLESFNSIFTSEIMEYLNVNAGVAITIIKRLQKEGIIDKDGKRK